LTGGVAVVAGHRGVVHGRDGEGDRGDVAVGGAVVGPVAEAVRAVVVGGGRVGEGAVGGRGRRAVGRPAHPDGPEGVAVRVGVIAEHAGGRDRQGRVLRRGEGVRPCHRRVVHRGDRDADGGDVAVGGAVVGLVAEAVAAVVVRRRRVAE